MNQTEEKETRANRVSLRGARISAMKARPVVDLIRKKSVLDAIEILQFTPKRVSPMLIELIESGLANIEKDARLEWDPDDLVVAEAYVNEGPTLRRFRPRAQGRATRINKRTCHITVVLEPKR